MSFDWNNDVRLALGIPHGCQGSTSRGTNSSDHQTCSCQVDLFNEKSVVVVVVVVVVVADAKVHAQML